MSRASQHDRILDSPETIWEKLKPAATDPGAVTRKDPGNPDICNIFTIHHGFSPPDTLKLVAHNCRTAGWGCLDCKRVGGQYDSRAHPHPRAAQALQAEPRKVTDLLRAGATKRAPSRAGTMSRVRRQMGFLEARREGSLMLHSWSRWWMCPTELFLQLCLATLFGGAIGSSASWAASRPVSGPTSSLHRLGALHQAFVHDGRRNATRRRKSPHRIVTGVGFIGAGTNLALRAARWSASRARPRIGSSAIGSPWARRSIGSGITTLLVLSCCGTRERRALVRGNPREHVSVHAHPGPPRWTSWKRSSAGRGSGSSGRRAVAKTWTS